MNDTGEISLCYTVTFRRRSKHPAARLWKAITDLDEVASWMGGPARVELRPGGEWFVDFSSTGEGCLDGVIIGFEEERKLTYAWGLSVVEWTIEPAEEGCSYTFVHNALADCGYDEEGLPAGWQSFFEVLERHLEGLPMTREGREARWERMKPRYREQLNRLMPGRDSGPGR